VSIDVVEARKLAARSAEANLRCFAPDERTELLRPDYAEGWGCWFFFRNPDVVVPPDRMLKGGWAYAVSKGGQVRHVYDFSGDAGKLKSYLQTMSYYFQRTGG
jgi:hypothetical protein